MVPSTHCRGFSLGARSSLLCTHFEREHILGGMEKASTREFQCCMKFQALCASYLYMHCVLRHPCLLQGNLRSAGFTVEERESFETNLLEGVGLVDTFRRQHPNTVAYTYWAYRSFARKANRGMRLVLFCGASACKKTTRKCVFEWQKDHYSTIVLTSLCHQ